MTQLVFRLLFLLADIVGNIYILSTRQALTLGGMSFDNGQFIVAFNAAMIMVIYIVDFIIVKTQRYVIDFKIGERLTNNERW